jgi:drug/metabolite transporter (DMT)-like permease
MGGAVAYAVTVILFVVSNKLTTAANAIVLQYTCPVYVAVLAGIMLGERTSLRAWIAVFFTMAGMILFFFDKLTPGGMWGNILSIISGLSLAFLVIFLRRQKNSSPVESILLGNIITVIVCVPFILKSPIPSARGIAALAILGIFQLGLSYILYAFAIKHIPALEAILIPIIEPLLNPLWVYLLIGEKPGLWALAGGAVVLVSVTAYSVIENRINGNARRDRY